VLGTRDQRLARQRHDQRHVQASLLPGGAQARAGRPRDYTDITTAISVALQDALRDGGSSGGAPDGVPGTSGSVAPSGGLGTDGRSTANPRLTSRTLQHAPSRSIYRRAVDKLGTTSADSLPIPLLVLAGLGTALLVAAIALAARKRLSARAERRMTLGRSP
jgi:hypothetical protein